MKIGIVIARIRGLDGVALETVTSDKDGKSQPLQSLENIFDNEGLF